MSPPSSPGAPAGSADELASGFDHNDHAMRARCAEVYGTLRRACPVFHSDEWGGFWVASRYEDVYEVGRDVDRFVSAPGVMLPPVGHGRPLLPMESDPPEHPAYRELLLPRFAPAAVAELEDDIRALAARARRRDRRPRAGRRLRAALQAAAAADDHAAARRRARRRVLGVDGHAHVRPRAGHPAGAHPRGGGRALRLPRPRGRASGAATPGGDLISLLLQGTVDGRPYREPEMLDLCFFLLIAGLENTGFGIRATLRHLAVRPDHRAAVLADPSLVHNAVEQSLRLYSPVTALCRTAAQDTEVNGQSIRAGERMLLLFGSANRDETVFEEADEFHLERRDGRHVAFGIGPHRCVGSHLARLEMRDRDRGVPAARAGLPPRARTRPGLVRGRPAGAGVGRPGGQRRRRVKVEVDRSMCVGHAQCSAICPTVFSQRRARLRRRRGRRHRPREDEEDAAAGGRLLPRAGDRDRRRLTRRAPRPRRCTGRRRPIGERAHLQGFATGAALPLGSPPIREPGSRSAGAARHHARVRDVAEERPRLRAAAGLRLERRRQLGADPARPRPAGRRRGRSAPGSSGRAVGAST